MLDFDVRFGIPRDIFLKKWNEIERNIKSVHASKNFDQNEIPTEFGSEIEMMLLLLQMLPDVPKGSKSAEKRWSFSESIKKFVVFSPVSEKNRLSNLGIIYRTNYVQMLTYSLISSQAQRSNIQCSGA